MVRIIGIVLVVLGVVGLLLGGLSFTTKEKVVDIGPIDVSTEKRHYAPLPAAASIAVLVVGGVLLVTSRKG